MLHTVERYDPVRDVYVMEATLTVSARVEVPAEKMMGKTSHKELQRKVKNQLEDQMLEELKSILRHGEDNQRSRSA